MTLNLYATDYWVPFPTSEYGGLVVFAATNVDEVIQMAKGMTWKHDMEKYGEAMFDPQDVRIIGTTDIFNSPCVVEEFTT